MRALGASAVAAIAKARALICEDGARRALADAQIRDTCAKTGEGVFASRRALHYGRAAVKRALKALDRNNSSRRERTTRARLAYTPRARVRVLLARPASTLGTSQVVRIEEAAGATRSARGQQRPRLRRHRLDRAPLHSGRWHEPLSRPPRPRSAAESAAAAAAPDALW